MREFNFLLEPARYRYVFYDRVITLAIIIKFDFVNTVKSSFIIYY